MNHIPLSQHAVPGVGAVRDFCDFKYKDTHAV
jgi:hypothetical protein